MPRQLHQGDSQVKNQVVRHLKSFVFLNDLTNAHHIVVFQRSHDFDLWIVFNFQSILGEILLTNIGLQLFDCIEFCWFDHFLHVLVAPILVFQRNVVLIEILVSLRLISHQQMSVFLSQIDSPERPFSKLAHPQITIFEF